MEEKEVNPQAVGDFFIDFSVGLWDTDDGALNKVPGAAQRQAVYHTTHKGVMDMPITLTFHVLYWTITIRVNSRNRHSGK